MSDIPKRIIAGWQDVKGTYVHGPIVDELAEALKECEAEIDRYIQFEYPSDHPVHERYRQRDYAANPARIALAKYRTETET